MGVGARMVGGGVLAVVMMTTGVLERGIGAVTASDHSGRQDVSRVRERIVRGFEEQVDKAGRTQFVSRAPDSTVVLRGGEATLAIGEASVRMQLVGAAVSARAEASQELGGVGNYLIGNDSTKWRTNVKSFGKVRFHEVYRGVDLVYYGVGQTLEYDFVVAPGASADGIRLHFDGVDRVTLGDEGGLRLQVGAREIQMDPPHLYQDAAAGRRTIAGRYVLDGSRDVRFEVGAYDHDRSLTIDPIITYSTYFGGRGSDVSEAVAVDDRGFIYLTGKTGSVNVNTFPLVHALKTDFGFAIQLAFITKLTPDGSTVVYSTYFGGTLSDEGHAIAVDHYGHVYVAGTTSSHDFPMVNAVQDTCGGSMDAFVAKLNPSGSALEYSTCIGGQDNDEEGFGLALDEDGNAYVTGYTRSQDFPTRKALQPVNGGADMDAFLSVIRPDGRDFVYSTFLGGTDQDEAHGVAVDARHNVYLTGRTRSTDFPVVNAFQPTLHGAPGNFAGISDAFVTKIDRTGQRILYSTYLGGTVGLADDSLPPGASRGGDEIGLAIAVDDHGNAIVTGRTNSTDFPTLNAAQSHLAGPQEPRHEDFTTDAFVARFDAAGVPSYLTYAGGNGNEIPTAIALDADGTAWITGTTESANFPTVQALQPTFGDHGVFSTRDEGATWHAVGGGIGGRDVRAVAVDPFNSEVIYAGTYGGGVFKSQNHGRTWIAINKGLGNLFVSALVIDPTNPSKLFAGSQLGVYRSLDGGANWQLNLGAGLPVSAMAISPTNPNYVYAGAAARIFGEIFSSIDGGNTWRSGVGADLVNGITVDPTTPTTVYVAMNFGLFKSTDAGVTFTFHQVVGSPFITNAFAIDPSAPSTVYAGTDGGMLKSTDGGVTWNFPASGLIGIVNALVVDPSTHTVYAATNSGVKKTTDGAVSWTTASTGITSPVVNTLTLGAGHPARLYAGSSGTTDTFVMAIRPNGQIQYSSFLGGNGAELGGGIAIAGHRVYVSGGTASSDFLTVNPVQPAFGGFSDAFVTVMSLIRDRQGNLY